MGLYRLFVALVVLVAVALMPLTVALAQQANPSRVLPGVVDNGETFDVTVNLTAPDDDFRLVTVVDIAPAGWNVTVNLTWCTPTPSFVIATGNKAQIVWSGPFSNGTPLAAVYKVTVPDDAESGFHTFNGLLGYYLASPEHIFENMTGDFQVFSPVELHVIRHINETLKSPNMLYPDDTFEVFLNWTAPLNTFSAISLTDLAPVSFVVEVNKTWCSPTANATKTTENKVEIAWYGPYDKGTNFTAKYKVTVPCAAAPGSHYFPYDNCSLSWLGYYFAGYGPYTSCTIGDSEVVVTVPSDIVGETRDVNANELSDVTVTLCKDASEITSDASTPNYTIAVNVTGDYWLRGSKDSYFDILTNDLPPLEPLYINLTTLDLLAAGCAFDFEGDYGLVPRTCNVSYAMISINHWLFTPIDVEENPHPEWQLSIWKAMESVHSWEFPS